MAVYKAPLRDVRFVLYEVLDLGAAVKTLPGYEEATPELVDQVLEDMDLAFELDRLGANLAGAFPEMPWGEPAWGRAERPRP